MYIQHYNNGRNNKWTIYTIYNSFHTKSYTTIFSIDITQWIEILNIQHNQSIYMRTKSELLITIIYNPLPLTNKNLLFYIKNKRINKKITEAS